MNKATIIFGLVLILFSSAISVSGAQWTESTRFSEDAIFTDAMIRVAALDDNHVWAAQGYNHIYFFNGSNWELQTSTWAGQTLEIKDLYSYGSSDTWMVGRASSSPYNGKIYHFDGSTWALSTELPSGVYCVWAASTNDIWAGGMGGLLLYSGNGGATWSVSSDTGGQLWMDMAGTDSSHIWVVGSAQPTQILFWDGANWDEQTQIDLGSSKYLRGVWAASESEVWAAGDSGYILSYDGSEWSIDTVVSGGSTNYAPVGGLDASHVWAGPRNSSGNLFFWDGSSWSVNTSLSTSREPVSLSGTTDTIWMGTEQTRVFSRFVPSPSPSTTPSVPPTPSPTPSISPTPSVTPTTIYVSQDWTKSTNISGENFRALAAGDDDAVWVASYTGNPGNIYSWDGSIWNLQTSNFPAGQGVTRGGYALSSTQAWMVGNTSSPYHGIIFNYDGSNWKTETIFDSTVASYVNAFYAADGANSWAACNGAVVQSTDGGSTWFKNTSIGGFWYGISGTDADHIWVVGEQSPAQILYYESGTWTVQTEIDLGPSKYLRSVEAISDTDVWAAGDNGIILHLDGSGEWEVSEDVGSTTSAASISARASDQVWAGFYGDDGGVYYYDGSNWARVSELDYRCYTIDASAPYSVWAIADGASQVWKLHIPSPSPSPSPSTTPTTTPTPSVTPSPSITPTPFYISQNWTLSTEIENLNLYAISATGDDEVWTSDCRPQSTNNGEIYQFNGTSWNISTSTFTAQTGRHRGIFAYDESNVWAVGNTTDPTDGIIHFFDGTSWSVQSWCDGITYIYDLYSPDGINAWAVCSSGNILTTNDGGTTWIQETNVGANLLMSIDGDGSGEIWATGGYSGQPGRIYRRSGGTWTLETEVEMEDSSPYIRSVSVMTSTDVWAAADSGVILHLGPGGEWEVSEDIGSNSNYAVISARESNQVWAGFDGNDRGLFFYDGAAWARVSGFDNSCYAIDASGSPNYVWATMDQSDQIWKLRFASPTPVGFKTPSPSPTLTPSVTPTPSNTPTLTPSTTPSLTPSPSATPSAPPSATPSPSPSITPTMIPTSTPTPITISQNWIVMTEIDNDNFSDIACSSNESWVGSNRTTSNGNIYHFNGSNWTIQTSLFTVQTGQVRGIEAFSTSRVWATGNTSQPTNGTIYGFNGSNWSQSTMMTTSNYIYDVYCPDSSTALAISQGKIYQTLDGGSTWTLDTDLDMSFVLGISGAGGDIWAVGGSSYQSSIYHRQGGIWSLETTVSYPTSGRYLRSVSANTQTDVWAAGDNGLILHRGENGQWTLSEDVGETYNNAKISTLNQSNVWAAFYGSSGGLYYYDGVHWARIEEVNNHAYAIEVASPNYAWAIAGRDNRIIRLEIASPTPIGFKTPSPTPSITPSITPSNAPTSSPTPSISPTTTPTPTSTPPTPTPPIIPTTSPTPSIIPTTPTPPQAIIGSITYTGWMDGGGLNRTLVIAAFLTPDPSGEPVALTSRGATKSQLETGAIFTLPITNGVYYLASFWDANGSGELEPSECDPERDGIGPITISGSDVHIPTIYLQDQCASPTPIPSPSPKLPAVVGDYDGDGTADIAIWRPSVTLWKIRDITRIYFGLSNDEPVPQDYNADGIWDLAFWRAPTSLWKIKDLTRIYFGTSSDIPIPADYDGDMTCDLAFHRPSSTLWKVKDLTRIYFGTSEDEPVVGDYSGDGAAEPAFWRASAGLWKMKDLTRIYFGTSEDNPIPGDYDGDGSLDPAFHRPASILWKVRDLTRIYFGDTSDLPIPADYNGDGTCDFGFFRAPSILWKIKDITRLYFGASDDIQVTNP